MPDATYFPEVRLNFAQNLLRFAEGHSAATTALVSISESRARRSLSYSALAGQVSRVAGALADPFQPGFFHSSD